MNISGYPLRALFCGYMLITGSTARPNTDSLAYRTLRTQAMHRDSTSQAFSSADALAGAGLYADAMQLLREFIFTGDTNTQNAGTSTGPSPHPSWRVSSGIDYIRIEDVDSTAWTEEKKRDYQRLTETPLSLWIRAGSSLHPENNFIEEIRPEAYVSERKGRFETAVGFLTAAGKLRIEPSVKVEKWFRTDASGDAGFEPFIQQHSDMGGASVRLNLDDPYTTAAITSFTVPLLVEWENYRHDRSGYEAFIGYRLSPSIDYTPRCIPLDLRLNIQTEYRNYYRPESKFLDIVSIGADVDAALRHEKRSGRLHCSWLGDRYPDNAVNPDSTHPAAIDRFEASFRGSQRIGGVASVCLSARGIYGYERYQSSDGQDTAAIGGAEISFTPGIDFSIFNRQCTIGPELLWERRRARQHARLWVWDSRTVFEPGIRIGWSRSTVEAALLAAYRLEDIDPQFTSEDSRSFRGNAECTWNFIPAASVYFFTEYQYRTYAPFGGHSRLSENIAVSMNVTIGM